MIEFNKPRKINCYGVFALIIEICSRFDLLWNICEIKRNYIYIYILCQLKYRTVFDIMYMH